LRWKYYIPHSWESPESRHVWEDVYLMPDIELPEGEEKVSIWLTVDALGFQPVEGDDEGWARYWETVEKLRDREYIIDRETCDMAVRVEDFNLLELLGYAAVFIGEVFGDHRVSFLEGTYEEFLGTNDHISLLEELGRAIVEREAKKKEAAGKGGTRKKTEGSGGRGARKPARKTKQSGTKKKKGDG